MQDRDLANRLVNYSDALVAVMFVGMSATGVALGDPDIRCEFSRAATEISISNLLMGVAFSGVLYVFRKWEIRLRAGDEEGFSEEAARIEKILAIARHVVLWISVILTVTVILVASQDTSCLIP